MTFNLLSSAWFFLLILPLIAFYFLKLRRQRLEIPSLVLWQQVLQDSRVNSPFQKFKRNILLLLQLLLLCLLVLAAMDPIVSGNSNDQKLPIIVDCSASMGALEKGQSRLAVVKEKLTTLINNKKSNQQIAIISFAQSAQKLCSFTTNRQILLKAVRDLKTVDLESDLESALKVTQAMTKSGTFGKVLLYTDGNFEDVPTFDLSFQLDYQLIGEGAPKNVGISRLSARRAGTTSWMVFVQLDSSEHYTETSTVEVYQDNLKIAEDSFSSETQKQQRLSFRVDGQKNSLIKVVLKPGGEDIVSADNEAYLDLSVARPLKVYISSSLSSIKSVLTNIPGLKLSSDPTGLFDLSISEKSEDEAVNALTSITIGYVPADIETLVETDQRQSSIIDWDRSSQLLQHVSLDDILLMKTYKMAAGVRPLEIEKKAYEVLATGEKAPLILKKTLADRVRYSCLFHLDQSTLPYKVAFPVLLANLITESLNLAGLAEKAAASTGYLNEFIAQKNSPYTITTPDGKSTSSVTDQSGVISGITAMNSGPYTIEQKDKVIKTFNVSLLSPLESRMSSIKSVKFNEVNITANEDVAVTDQPLWANLAALAFLLLVIEWWFYQKRPGKIFALK